MSFNRASSFYISIGFILFLASVNSDVVQPSSPTESSPIDLVTRIDGFPPNMMSGHESELHENVGPSDQQPQTPTTSKSDPIVFGHGKGDLGVFNLNKKEQDQKTYSDLQAIAMKREGIPPTPTVVPQHSSDPQLQTLMQQQQPMQIHQPHSPQSSQDQSKQHQLHQPQGQSTQILNNNQLVQQQQQQLQQIAMDGINKDRIPSQYQPQQLKQTQQQQVQQQQQQQSQQKQPSPSPRPQQQPPMPYGPPPGYFQPLHPLYIGHNPFIDILRPHSYVDDNIVTLNLSHSHIYEIDTDAFVGQRLEYIDLSNNKLGLIHSRSFQIGPSHSGHQAQNSIKNTTKPSRSSRRPPPSQPMNVTIDFSHNPAILALPGAFDHIDVPNCLLNFTNSTVELKYGSFRNYLRENPGHMIDIESIDCCEQEWLLGYRHNFMDRTHCDHDPNLILTKATSQQAIIDSCIEYVTRARHSMKIQGPSIIHQLGPSRGHANSRCDCHYLTYIILGGTAVVLTSLSIFIIFYMFNLKATFVYQMQNKS